MTQRKRKREIETVKDNEKKRDTEKEKERDSDKEQERDTEKEKEEERNIEKEKVEGNEKDNEKKKEKRCRNVFNILCQLFSSNMKTDTPFQRYISLKSMESTDFNYTANTSWHV